MGAERGKKDGGSGVLKLGVRAQKSPIFPTLIIIQRHSVILTSRWTEIDSMMALFASADLSALCSKSQHVLEL